MRGGGAPAKSGGDAVVNCSRIGVVDPEELKRLGNEQYKTGSLSEALGFYDRAIDISPGNATYRFNKAVALTGLKLLGEAVREYEEAVRLDAGYVKAHHRLGSLLVRLGQGENARRHICHQGYQPDANELQKLQALETHLRKCTDARKIGDWRSALREVDAAIAAGADASPQLERWAEAVRNYEVLSRELPHDNEVAESLFHAQVAMKKSRGEDVHNLKFGGEVESVSGLEQFRAAISSPGASEVHFKAVSNLQCKQISPFLDTLCGRFPSINFLKTKGNSLHRTPKPISRILNKTLPTTPLSLPISSPLASSSVLHLSKPNTMDREQEDMQFLGLSGIYLESYKIIFNFRRIFSKITLAFILPLSLILLAHIEVSDFILSKIIRTENQLDQVREGSYRYDKLSDVLSSEWVAFLLVKFAYLTFYLVFSLLSTSAVVYTVASVYTHRDVTFGKVMSVVPKVWKRLMVTFLCAFLMFLVYSVVLVLTIILWIVPFKHVDLVGQLYFLAIMILYIVGLLYMAVVWELASVISVLEDIKGFKAMTKSRKLIEGKMWIAAVIFLKLHIAKFWIQKLFESVVVDTESSFGVAGRLGIGFLCLLMLFKVFLFGLVIQTVIYFVCKSYHHENIDKSSLSDRLEVYLGEYVPLKAKDVQLEEFGA
ncbi:hypothetical protein RHMOL_Rhmol11G0136700 [Rhododendron molle]|uniref:Uncharacterized protein n=1 Tax=Rhododendron molle TaxID=49168 RepID=A0ACC0LTJ4_RHOML|nr:hypothetical protein RHMOL_Rhmol11G0136700 [Rhododendron molle]